MTSLINAILARIQNDRAPAVTVVVGCKGSGKSYAASNLEELLSRDTGTPAYLLDASAILRPDARSRRTENPCDREVDAILERVDDSREPLSWIIDNADSLLAFSGRRSLERLGEATSRGALRLVLFRSPLVRPDAGWFSERERDAFDSPSALQLEPLQGEDAVRFAETLYGARSNRSTPQAVDWLLHWSGGLPGLMKNLKPYTPSKPDLHTVPNRWPEHRSQLRGELRLDLQLRMRILLLARQRLLPPLAFLEDRAREIVGLFVSLGVLAPEYAFSPSPFQGHFWESLTDDVPLPGISTPPDEAVSIGRSLESRIRAAGEAPELCAELGCPDEPGVLQLVFSNAIRSLRTESGAGLVLPLSDFLATWFGVSGMRRLLASDAGRDAQRWRPRELARLLIEAPRS